MDTDFVIRYIRNRECVLIDETTAQGIKEKYEVVMLTLSGLVAIYVEDSVMGGTRSESLALDKLHEDFTRALTEGWQAIAQTETPDRLKAIEKYEAIFPTLYGGVAFEGEDLVMGGTRSGGLRLIELHEDFLRVQTEGWQAIEIPETPERMRALKDARYIMRYLRDQHHLLIGERQSEMAQMQLLGSESPAQEGTYAARGRDMVSGLPATVELTSTEVKDALARFRSQEPDTSQKPE